MGTAKHGKKPKSATQKRMDRPSKVQVVENGHAKLSNFFAKIGLVI